MKITHFFIALGAMVLLWASSCAPAYIPNVVNTPLLTNKGEFQGAIYSGTAGYDPQFAYAVSDHFGLMLNGSFANRSSDTTNNFHKHNFGEIGGGYFTKFGGMGRFEAYGGTGIGNLSTFFENSLWESSAKVNTTRFFVQPSIGITTSFIDFSFSTRLVALRLKQEGFTQTGFFFEPVLTTKAGYKYVKGVFQLGFTTPLNNGNINFEYQPFLLSVGLQATLGRKYSDDE